jgi:hypothetical protein
MIAKVTQRTERGSLGSSAPRVSGVQGHAALRSSSQSLMKAENWFQLRVVGVTTFMMVNVVYMPLFEEPGLVARFGEGYREYSNHVPRWIPRSTPWSSNGNHDNGTLVGGPADEPPTS